MGGGMILPKKENKTLRWYLPMTLHPKMSCQTETSSSHQGVLENSLEGWQIPPSSPFSRGVIETVSKKQFCNCKCSNLPKNCPKWLHFNTLVTFWYRFHLKSSKLHPTNPGFPKWHDPPKTQLVVMDIGEWLSSFTYCEESRGGFSYLRSLRRANKFGGSSGCFDLQVSRSQREIAAQLENWNAMNPIIHGMSCWLNHLKFIRRCEKYVVIMFN